MLKVRANSLGSAERPREVRSRTRAVKAAKSGQAGGAVYKKRTASSLGSA
jgi:hypothetical protein